MDNDIKSFKDINDIELLNTKQLKALLHIKGDLTLWRYLKENRIPQPKFSISRSNRLWDKAEVLNHLAKNNQG